MLFTARHLAKQFTAGTRSCSAVARVLTDVELDLEPGRIVGVVGPRASGKTTLLRCVAGLARPDSGVVRWAPGAQQARVVALAPAALPYETVIDVVVRSYELSPVDPDAAEHLIDQLGLRGVLKLTLAALTTDERARLALALGLATRHPILLLDGTADALAAGSRPRARAVLEAHAAQGGAALVAGRDAEAVSALAPVVLELSAGRLGARAVPSAARLAAARVAERSIR